jgi:glycosyltransferase involved in cell wall biosynthesis
MLQSDWCKDTTCVITCFGRVECLNRTIKEARKRFPQLKIIVADYGDPCVSRNDVDIHKLSYDIGIAFARNYLIRQVTTPYVLLMDDDHVFTDNTDVQQLYNVMIEDTADIAGGWITNRFSWHNLFLLQNSCLYMLPIDLSKVPVNIPVPVHCCENFFLAKTKILQNNPWNNYFKIGEHLLFMYNCWQANVRIKIIRSVEVLDTGERPTQIYSEARNRSLTYRKEALDLIAKRQNLKKFYDGTWAAGSRQW